MGDRAQDTRGHRATGARLETMKASPQWKDGRFRNLLDRQDAPLLKSLAQWARGAEHTVPDEPPPIEARSRGDLSTPPPVGLRVTWLSHSTTLVEIDGHRLLLDPVWSERASPVSWAGPKRFHPPPLPLAELPPVARRRRRRPCRRVVLKEGYMASTARSTIQTRYAQMFPTLEAAEVERLRRFGEQRTYAAGESLVTTGEVSWALTSSHLDAM